MDLVNRATVKLKNPNPLFEKWLTEWLEKAKQQNSKMQYTFKLALQSLKKYPVPLESGRECKILKGFGDKLCLMLDNKLKEYKKNGNAELNEGLSLPLTTSNSGTKRKKSQNTEAKNSSKTCREYIPQYRSGAYAILITLYEKSLEPNYPGFLKKDAIIEGAQFLTDCSFTKPEPGSQYTAWSSMRTLLSKELVIKKSNPAKFSLSNEGVVLARKLFERAKLTSDAKLSFSGNDLQKCLLSSNTCSSKNTFSNTGIITLNDSDDENSKDKPSSLQIASSTSDNSICTSTNVQNIVIKEGLTIPNISNSNNILFKNTIKKSKSKTIYKHSSHSSTFASTGTSAEQETFIFLPGSFDIILYVDMQEVVGKKHEDMLKELKHLSVIFEIKHLKVGDFTWICRDRETKKELVLPYIVERKRMDDFAKSIKDGRYYEQKFRLKKSGIENIIYLIESYGKTDEHLGLPFRTLMQAAASTAIQDFFVKFTENLSDTAQYLALFSKKLLNLFQSKTVVSCPKQNLSPVDFEDDLLYLIAFEEFNKSSIKNKRPQVSDLFVKMLIQIKGMSVDKALAIVQQYPTPAILLKAYEKFSSMQGEKLLANIKFGMYNKSIGAPLSKTVYQLFTKVSFTT